MSTSKGTGKDKGKNASRSMAFHLSDAQFAALSASMRTSRVAERTIAGAREGGSDEIGAAAWPGDDASDLQREPGTDCAPW